MPKLKAYSGGCHRGRVRDETTTDPNQAIACNCSICAKHGLWLTFVTPQQFKLVSGLDDLADYQLQAHHPPCIPAATAGWIRSPGARRRTARKVCHQCAPPRRRRMPNSRPNRSTAAACDARFRTGPRQRPLGRASDAVHRDRLCRPGPAKPHRRSDFSLPGRLSPGRLRPRLPTSCHRLMSSKATCGGASG